MTTNSHLESAQIYNFAEFAARLRPAGPRREEVHNAADLMAPRLPQMSSGGAWYHEEAIQDAGEPRTH